MSIAYYIIPMVPGPYSRENKMRPMYLDGLSPCAWTGHNVDAFGVYVCKVSTTSANHYWLSARPGVIQISAGDNGWDAVIETIPRRSSETIASWCNRWNIAYDGKMTVGRLLMRIIGYGVLAVTSATSRMPMRDLPQAQREHILRHCVMHNIPYSSTDTIDQIIDRAGPVFWNGRDLYVQEVNG